MENNKNIALVLSGGGARGLAHIGVIEELLHQGFKIDSITGTSMGALVGGFYAMGKLSDFKEWIVRLNRYSFVRLLDFSFRGGFLKGEKVLNVLQSFIPDQNIEHFNIPFRCLATDLESQQSVILDSGNFYEAVRASFAIPSVFTPVKRDGMLLVDGGVLNNIPVDSAVKAHESDIVFAVDVNARVPMMRKNHRRKSGHLSAIRLSNKVISLMTETIGDLRLKETPPDFMVQVSRQSCELYEFYKAKQQIEYGRKCAVEQLKKYPF